MGGGISSSFSSPSSSHPSSKKLFNELEIDSIIGEGGFSTVYGGRHKETKTKIAVKRINIMKYLPTQTQSQSQSQLPQIKEGCREILVELNAFKRIGHHDFIVTLHSAFRHNVCCYLVMDCLGGGDLRHFMRINGSLSEQSVVYIVGCIGSALHHIHERGVIHRDVKPENIGLDTLGRPYLTDFGISLVSNTNNPIPLCESSSGTLPYLAPEVLAPGNCHSYQSDYLLNLKIHSTATYVR